MNKTFLHASIEVNVATERSLTDEQIANYTDKKNLNAADFRVLTGHGIGTYEDFTVTQVGVVPKDVPDNLLALLDESSQEQALKLLNCRLAFPCTLKQLTDFVAVAGWPESLPDGYQRLVTPTGRPSSTWVPLARQMGEEWMISNEKRSGNRPTVTEIAKHLEGELSTRSITGARGKFLDWETIKREALTGITGRKKGDNFKDAMGNPQRRRKSPIVKRK